MSNTKEYIITSDKLTYAYWKDIYYTDENGRDDYIQNINEFSDKEIEAIDYYNKTRNKICFWENFTKADILDFLGSHAEWEHIEMDYKDLWVTDLVWLDDTQLVNLAIKYWIND